MSLRHVVVGIALGLAMAARGQRRFHSENTWATPSR
jgi:hypothetical protein